MQPTKQFIGYEALNIGEGFRAFPSFLYRTALRSILSSFAPYHPVKIGSAQLSKGERSCIDRWRIIESEIAAAKAATLLDVGCAEGYFVMQAASVCGCTALGVDGDVRRLSLAQGSTLLNHIKGAGFIYADITPQLLSRLPISDVVLFQSVLHHIMYNKGIDYAREIMVSLRPKVGKVLIFDMGQSDETTNKWASSLPDMGKNPHVWIQDFLRSAGYPSVEKLEDTDSYRSATKRAVFRLSC
jgi:cyclopropane fatty-acyl-phospholipid synthase-like methyltransferase